ncbi:hypothetical protein F7725_010808 [Dissostichus mawsoni]|uniref:Ig-like domain-containing protein n=1 Tax=Dissostichus mawsoni TaxID=36200 RepID=A0A7J5ZA74_DISMA|nr:hypothetical protein F7725_010808 [Dissostichus mawsoni]
MEKLAAILLCSALIECKGEDTVKQTAGDVRATEGDKLHLTAHLRSFHEDRFDATLNETSVPLQISSAVVTDSAVYYFALQPTVTGNNTTLYKNLWSRDNTILINIHQREPLSCKGVDTVTQPAGDVRATEGGTVTLGCKFQTSTTAYLFWYKQEVNGYPKYMLRRYSATGVNAAEFQKDRFDATLNKTSVPLQISSAAVTDSAVYYCALRPTVTGNTTTLYKNLWSKDNTILHNIQREPLSTSSTAYLFWYKQEVNGYPKYMLKRFSATGDNAAEFKKDRFDATLNEKSVPLQISSAAVTDSAVYYCALSPHDRLCCVLLCSAAHSDRKHQHSVQKPLEQRQHNTAQHPPEGCKGVDTVTQPAGDVRATEGNTVTLGCKFPTSTTAFLFWYKQEVNGYPKYMLKRFSATGVNAAEFQKDRFDATLNKTSVPLQISSAAVTDSAVYYCALKPTVTGNTTTLRDTVTQPAGDVRATEGGTVTLGCKFQTSSTAYLFWYKQEVNVHVKRYSATGDNAAEFKKDRFDATLNEKSFPLQISSAAVTDSAVYYCALRPTVTGNTTLCTKTFGAKTTQYCTTSTRGSLSLSEEHVAEGRNISLTCKYEGTIYNIQWYRQYQRSRPEFLLYITEAGVIHPTESDFSAHIDKTEKRVDLDHLCCSDRLCCVLLCSEAHSDRKHHTLYFLLLI